MNPNPASSISECVQPRRVVAKPRARARAPAPISHWKRHRLATGVTDETGTALGVTSR
jgi:hypothetical protein